MTERGSYQRSRARLGRRTGLGFAWMTCLLAALCATLPLGQRARAYISQADGVIVPQSQAVIQSCLDRADTGEGGSGIIDAVADARVLPESYRPVENPIGSGLYPVDFRAIAEGAGYENSFGYYWVDEDPSDPANLHTIFDCRTGNTCDCPCNPNDMRPGSGWINAFDFKERAGAAFSPGRAIGFWLRTPENIDDSAGVDCGSRTNTNQRIYFTSKELNNDGDYVHFLVYRSITHENTFYFGFEDLWRGGDNDFEDMLVRATGLLPLCEPQPETCDTVDEDCDLNVDEGLDEACATACGSGVKSCVGGAYGDCSAASPVSETCDGTDEDCDGNTDEGLSRACSNECGSGTELCSAGDWVDCDAPTATIEICNGADDDCDSSTDESITRACSSACGSGTETCVAGAYQGCDAPGSQAETCDGSDEDCDGKTDEGLTRSCSTACGTGTETCISGSYVGCSASPPGTEICNNADDDCDSSTDEGLVRSCSTTCGAGVETCSAGSYGDCTAPQPGIEACDGVDDDCDGSVDEGLSRACSSECGGGTELCSAGDWVSCNAPTPSIEICNGLDDDCDSSTDESITRACSSACGSGTETCVSGTYEGCDAPGAQAETCDGSDEDCDGKTDEGLTRSCSTACGTGTETCISGSYVGCSATAPGTEICNNADDDCDSSTDEGLVRSCSTSCGAGVETCSAGSYGDCNAPQPVVEDCDGVDDDCDGSVDEGLSRPCSNDCGSGTELCSDGDWVGCNAPTASIEICNGTDDDCDGDTDESITQSCSSQCGSGQQTCVDGTFEGCDAATPGTETCDGSDEDCDGKTDEGLTRSCSTLCDDGVETCISGAYVGCTAEAPDTEVCDDVDNDCDGTVDEELVRACSSDCGLGSETCVAGVYQDCDAQLPGTERCDGVDEDCDGTVDEGLTQACASECGSGQELCSEGSWVDCSAPTPTIETCNGADDDCDGSVDEGITRACFTACGDGQETCVAGAYAGCDAPPPGAESCDGTDEDCDGKTDEGLTRACATDCGSGIETCVSGAYAGCSAVVPGTELCNGVDDDCDGDVDEQITRTCSSDCGSGTETCLEGVYQGCDAPQPAPELCNGGDDNCNGLVDEGNPGGGEACMPTEDGYMLLLESVVDDLCQPGRVACVEGELLCSDASSGTRELCNCLDDDCDGSVDEGSLCGDGGCVDCACVSPCTDGEFPCPPGKVCDKGYADEDSGRVGLCLGDRCKDVECGEDEICDGSNGVCVDLCADRECPESKICIRGICVEDSCYGRGCPVGERCRSGECEADPCLGDDLCEEGEFCREGECISICQEVCGAGEMCNDGQCLPADCGAACQVGETCVDGFCIRDTCSPACGPGRICMETSCVDDPCESIECPSGSKCYEGSCGQLPIPSLPPPIFTLTTGGGGCACDLARGPAERGRSAAHWLLLSALVLWWLRRRAGHRGALRRLRGQTLVQLLGVVVCCLCTACDVDPYCIANCEDDTLAAESAAQEAVRQGNEAQATVPDPDECVWVGNETCNQKDDDCDGKLDEGFDLDADAVNCGGCEQVCFLPHAFPGCQEGLCVVERCEVGFTDLNGLGTDGCEYACQNTGFELCDELDNDCDGVVDEGFDLMADVSNCGACDNRCVYAHAGASCVGGNCERGQCGEGFIDLNANGDDGCEYACQNPLAETCNRVDDDCDGAFDETFDLASDTSHCGVCNRRCSFLNAGARCDQGVCALGDCEAGFVDADGDPSNGCEYGCTVEAGGDVCDGADNDCDGAVDESEPSEGMACGSGTGSCEQGVITCQLGMMVCVGGRGPTQEVCNGDDEDCDGNIDESTVNFPVVGTGVRCGETNTGVCEFGTVVCQGGALTCGQGHVAAAASETCGDNLDNDCNGARDDGCVVPCTSSAEVCNGQDEDCDSEVDEDFTFTSDASNCGTCGKKCSFLNAAALCVDSVCEKGDCADDFHDIDGDPNTGCEYGCTATGIEACNGSDDDCDGRVDEDDAALGAVCGSATGACQEGVTTCENGSLVCAGDLVASMEVCNEIDDDCDGRMDEDAVGTGVRCGETDTGACVYGSVVCSDGSLVCGGAYVGPAASETCGDGVDNDCNSGIDDGCEDTSCVPASEACNGLDEDCDNKADEDYDFAGDATNCGTCGTTCIFLNAVANCSASSCVMGACQNNFYDIDGDPSTGCEYGCTAAGSEVCNGSDDDCDGRVDETDAALGGACGSATGACEQGVTTCANGSLVCSGNLVASSEVCNDVDDDCDGNIDEDAGGTGARCGATDTGVCVYGSVVCSGGALSCGGAYVGPAGSETCGDGVDNDCNGGIDDGCADTSCVPVAETCNGLDEDCDNKVDEAFDFASDATNCGTCGTTCNFLNAAANCSASSCVMGSCQSNFHDIDGDPSTGCEYGCTATGIESCNGSDDDCDGRVDESDASMGAACGSSTGACEQGVTTCENGSLVCSGDLVASTEVCNDVDDDCDGSTDEDAVGTGARCGATDKGPCVYGSVVCTGGALTCGGAYVGPTTEVCNGVDDDCDDAIDDSPTAPASTPASCLDELGVCAGREAQCNGASGWGCAFPSTYQDTESLCDGLDNDCNGSDDEGCLGVAGDSDTRLDVGDTASTENSIGPRICGDGTDRLYVTWMDLGGSGAARIQTTRSTNSGDAWQSPLRGDSNSGASVSPRIAWGGGSDADVVVVWPDFRGSDYRQIRYRVSDDHLNGWDTSDQRLNSNQTNNSDGSKADSFNVSVAFSGSVVHVVWEAFTSYTARHVFYARSTNDGVSFGNPVQMDGATSTKVASSPRVAAAGDNVHLVWRDNRSGGLDVYVRSSTDAGASFGSEVRLDVGTSAGASASFQPEVAAEGDNAYVVWVDDLSGESFDIYLNRTSNAGASWLSADAVSLDQDTLPHDSISPRVVAPAAGVVGVAWIDYRYGFPDILFTRSGDSGASFSGPVRLDTTEVAGTSGSYDLTLDGDGDLIVAAWADDRGGFLDIYANFSLDGGQNFQPQDLRLDSSGIGTSDSEFPQVHVQDGKGHVVWVDHRAGDDCPDVSGTSCPNGDIFFRRIE